MAVRSSFKQAQIRRLYRLSLTATAPANTLLAQIEAFSDSMVASTNGGRSIIKVGSNGLQTDFSDNAKQRDESIDLANELQNTYNAALVELTDDGELTPDDEAILDRMVILLGPQVSRGSDYSLVNSYL